MMNGKEVQRLLARTCVAALGLSLASAAAHAAAQPPAPQASGSDEVSSGVPDIVVTAQKRSQRLQDVPLSVTAITASDLTAKGGTGTADLAVSVPGLAVQRSANNGNIFLRGVGSNLYGPAAEQPVAMFIDGVYMPSPEANIFEFNNIERIEVLKGPQGTLFGRNTTGGLIHVVTRDPGETPAGNFEIGLGNYDAVSASAYLETGLADGLSANISGIYRYQGRGWGRDITTGSPNFKPETYSVRSKWLWRPGAETTVRLSGDYTYFYTTDMYRIPRGGSYVDGGPFPGRYNARAGNNEYQQLKIGGGSVEIDQGLGSVQLVSISAYRDSSNRYFNDQDKTPLPVVGLTIASSTRNFSQELRLQNSDQGPFQWVVGGYYFWLKGSFDDIRIQRTGIDQHISDFQTTESLAGFAQGTFEFAKDTHLTLGGRYTDERQRFVVRRITLNGTALAVPGLAKQSFSRLTWRASLDHKFTADVMAYASFNRGFKSGGFNGLAPTDPPYKPEKLDAYEVGLKSDLLDRRLRLNVAAFWYEYTNIQVATPSVGIGRIGNGAAGRVKGIEADFRIQPVADFSISGGFTYTDAKFTDYRNAPFVTALGVSSIADATGHDLLGAPPFVASITADYRIRTESGSFRPSVTLLYSDKYFFYPDNRQTNPAHTLLNASLGWTSADDRWSIRIWGKNLGDAHYLQSAAESAFRDQVRPAAPRTFGIALGARF